MGLYKFQHDDIKTWYYDMNRRGILDWSCGTGKTFLGAILVERYLKDSKKILIVAPNSLILDWCENVEEKGIVIKQLKKTTKKEMAKPDDVVILSYGSLGKVKGKRFDLIIADECHRVKSYSSKQSKLFKDLAQNSSDLLMMSGTLWQHRDSQELLNYLWSINSEHINRYVPKNITQYRAEYTKEIPGPNNMRWHISTEKGSKLVKSVLDRYVLTRKLTDVIDMPRFIEKVVKVDCSYSMKDMIKKLEKEMNFTINTSYEKPHLSHSLMLANGMDFETKELINDVKIETLMEILDAIPEEEQVIVWYYWKKYGDFVQNALVKNKVSFGYVNSKVNITDRKKITDDFVKGKFRVLIAGQGTLAEGFNLQNARYSIFINIWYDYLKYEQCIGRIYRNKQTKRVANYLLVSKNSIEETTLKVLQHKMSLEEAKDFLLGTLRDKFKKQMEAKL